MPGSGDARTPRREVALLLATYAAVALVFLYREMTVPRPDPASVVAGDLIAYYYPMLRWGAMRLAAGELPLWNPHQTCGTPFLAIPQVGLLYPPYLPFLVLPASLAVDIDVLVHLLVAALGMALLCRHVGLTPAASAIAGLVYALQGSVMLTVPFPNFLLPVAWFPWIVWYLDRTLDEPGWRAALGLAVVTALSLLGANVQFLYYELFVILPWLVVRGVRVAWTRGAHALRDGVLAAVLGVVLGVALALVRIVPAAEYIALSWRPPGGLTREMVGIMAISPASFVRHLLLPEATAGVRDAYAGTVALVLALIGLLFGRFRSVTSTAALAGTVGMLYAFGEHAAVMPFFSRLPLGAWFRGPRRALFVFGFAVALLAGAAIAAVQTRAGRWRKASPILVYVTIGLVCAVAVAQLRWGGAWRLTAYHAAAAVCLAGIAFGPRPARAVALAAIGALVVVDLLHAQRLNGAIPSRLPQYLARHADLFATIAARQGFERTYVRAGFRSPLHFHSDVAKAGMNHGLWLATDYEALCLARTARYQSALGPAFPICHANFVLTPRNARLAELLGVRFYVVEDGRERQLAPDADWFAENFARVAGANGVTVYAYRGWAGRAFVVGGVEPAPGDPKRELERLQAIDVRHVALVDEPLQLPDDARPGEEAVARIVEYAPERVVVETGGSHGGLLVLTDQYYPGWEASVDGQATRVHRVDSLFRGVVVPAGAHRVEFRFRPGSVRAGALGTLAGVSGCVALVVFGVRRERRAKRRAGYFRARAT